MSLWHCIDFLRNYVWLHGQRLENSVQTEGRSCPKLRGCLPRFSPEISNFKIFKNENFKFSQNAKKIRESLVLSASSSPIDTRMRRRRSWSFVSFGKKSEKYLAKSPRNSGFGSCSELCFEPSCDVFDRFWKVDLSSIRDDFEFFLLKFCIYFSKSNDDEITNWPRRVRKKVSKAFRDTEDNAPTIIICGSFLTFPDHIISLSICPFLGSDSRTAFETVLFLSWTLAFEAGFSLINSKSQREL